VVAALAVTTLLAACGSSESSPAAQPAPDAGNPDAGSPFVVCPAGLEPTFESINSKIFAVSCGTGGSICHSAAGFFDSGGLNLADDPYAALLGADGRGAPSQNILGSATMRRVSPGDPDNSLLYRKLSTKTGQSPEYGSGMPFGTPGSVCPEALDVVRSWIQSGATR
jgi:hypothetical protein